MQVSVVRFRPWAPPSKNLLTFQTLTKGGTRTPRKVGHACSRSLPLVEQVHRCFRELLLIGFARVVLRLLDRIPTEDRHQLTRGRAVICDLKVVAAGAHAAPRRRSTILCNHSSSLTACSILTAAIMLLASTRTGYFS